MNTARCNIRTTTVAAFMLVAAAAIGAQDAEGQRRGNASMRGNMGMRAGTVGLAPVEQALRRADALELTEDQVTRLEALRVGALAERTASTGRLMELASGVRAGTVERGAIREEMAALLEMGATARENLRDQLSEILTDDQQAELRQAARRAAWQNRRGTMPRVDRRRGSWRGRGIDRGRRGAWAPRRDRRGR
ncbi:MAG: hypothetical protein F4Z31_01470 [Gemmatimonadetes bacterium]|nr:Spy/CpxP family protein refolding chaperone [Gemmatimonadota bacterium]MYA40451.1 hypothetical protein [Gemmatimonadota bacterium]MYE93698.1 hypothetical protein [Gemmatimonadota bacterium]MYJ10545.1 hypothetical protein [Gemmatimonadota bacterium]